VSYTFPHLPTGIPIFAVAEEGALADLLGSTGSGLWATGDPRQIAQRFVEFLRLPRRTPECLEQNLNGRFQYRELASQFGGWVHALVSKTEDPKAILTTVAF